METLEHRLFWNECRHMARVFEGFHPIYRLDRYGSWSSLAVIRLPYFGRPARVAFARALRGIRRHERNERIGMLTKLSNFVFEILLNSRETRHFYSNTCTHTHAHNKTIHKLQKKGKY